MLRLFRFLPRADPRCQGPGSGSRLDRVTLEPGPISLPVSRRHKKHVLQSDRPEEEPVCQKPLDVLVTTFSFLIKTF